MCVCVVQRSMLQESGLVATVLLEYKFMSHAFVRFIVKAFYIIIIVPRPSVGTRGGLKRMRARL